MEATVVDNPAAGRFEIKVDGQVASTVVPRAGDLAAEQLTQNYNDVGLPTTITSSAAKATA